MSLTVKDRAKINAALTIIHDQGGDVATVTATANAIMATGRSRQAAYYRALNQFVEKNPGFTKPIAKVTTLVEASCPQTVARYDQALSAYIATGVDVGLRALAPMIEQDSRALAVKSGEMTAEEAGAASSSDLLGLAADKAMALQQPVPQTFVFDTGAFPAGSPALDTAQTVAGREVVGWSNGSPIVRTNSQVSAGGGVTGMVAPGQNRGWSDINQPIRGSVSTGPVKLSLPGATVVTTGDAA